MAEERKENGIDVKGEIEFDRELDEIAALRNILDRLTTEVQPLRERILYEISTILFDRNRVKMISDLTARQFDNFVRFYAIDRFYVKRFAKSNNFEEFLKDILELSISKNRSGRKEILEMFRNVKLEEEKLAKIRKLLEE